jgi:osmotically-inducible protein OsmY
MNEPLKRIGRPVLLFMLFLFQTTPVLARSDDIIQREIEALFAGDTMLRDTRIKVHVEDRLVVLTGEVRLYEQKLITDRMAWTTLGVLEVENEILVIPKVPLSDMDIERKIREAVKADVRFHGAGVEIAVNNGEVSIQGSFAGIGDPVILKHKVAEIEGVVDIRIIATFLARSGGASQI